MKTPLPSYRLLLPLLASLLLGACGDSADTQTKTEIKYDVNNPRPYTGPADASTDVTAFRRYLWQNISGDDRCGSCHAAGQQSPQFVRADDINLAYQAALEVVDLENPEDSRLVQRVANGHNCWTDDDDVCAEIMTTYIRNWALATVGGAASEITLVAPPDYAPGASKNFPPDSTLFGTYVHPLLTEYCAGCHAPNAANPQSPYFASSDIDAAYAAARNAIDLNDPANSRFVQRLANEFHNCWDDCDANAIEMTAAITAMANQVPLLAIDPALVVSRALALREGIVASTGGRHEATVIAKYEFKEGSGTVAHDTSGVSPSMDLVLSGTTEWVGGWGMRFDGGKAQASTLSSRKLYDQLTLSGEYTIEAWVAPANVTQEGPARIASYSGGEDARNFMLGQSMYNYDFLNRNDTSDANGEPALSTADADERLQATLQHVVVTYSPTSGRRIYVNGEHTGDLDPSAGSGLSAWNNSFALVLGSEVDGSNPFRGVVRLLAIHKTALSATDIADNFNAGVGERFFLLFNISHLVDASQVYVLFEGSQFDSYSYLFAAPRVISLDPDYTPGSIPLAGMRIGINGREAGVGQAYTTLDTTLDDGWLPGSGKALSPIGTVIPLENGPDFDQFFLTFERLGVHSHVVVEAVPAAPGDVVGDPLPDIGLRTFDYIYASLAEITGIPVTEPSVAAMYERVKQQLPATDLITSFSSAHQIGVTQLAIEYCNALVDDPSGFATVYFAGFGLDAPYTTALDTPAERLALIDPLIVKVANNALLSMPDVLDMQAELDALILRLVASSGAAGGTCGADPVCRTQTIAKAVCTAAAGNAAMLLL